MIVCERLARWGGARGPPGTDGVVSMFTGRGAGSGGFDGIGFPDDCEAEPLKPLLSFLVLAILPSEEKKAPAFPPVIGDASMRVDGVGELEEDDHVGRCWLLARDGYGRGGGAVGMSKSSVDLIERSVATEASSRMGKVTAEIPDDRDVCLGCPPADNPSCPETFWVDGCCLLRSVTTSRLAKNANRS
jgi:hypothetical protein